MPADKISHTVWQKMIYATKRYLSQLSQETAAEDFAS